MFKKKPKVKNFLIGLCVTPEKNNLKVCNGDKGELEYIPANFFNKSSSVQILFFKATVFKGTYKVISNNVVNYTGIFPDSCNPTFQYELKDNRLFKTGLYNSKGCSKKQRQAFKRNSKKPMELFYKRASISNTYYKNKIEKYEAALKRVKKKKVRNKTVKKNIRIQSMYSCGSSKNIDTAYRLASSIWPYIGDSNFVTYWNSYRNAYSSVATCYQDKPKIKKLSNEKKVYTTKKGINIYVSKFIHNNGIGSGSAIYVFRQAK